MYRLLVPLGCWAWLVFPSHAWLVLRAQISGKIFVNGETRQPGPGFFELAAVIGHNVAELDDAGRTAFWCEQLSYTLWWWNRPSWMILMDSIDAHGVLNSADHKKLLELGRSAR